MARPVRPHIIVPVPLAERQLLSRIRLLSAQASSGTRSAGTSRARLLTSIGDDCAVLRIPRNHELLVTTDFSLEGVHFRREWHSPQWIGHHCLTRGLSDIAAMGGEPVAAFLSLALPNRTSQSWVDGFFEGILKLAKEFRMPLAGGDTAQSPNSVLADIVVLGSVPRGKAILRSGARPGDRIYVTGELGGAAAELKSLYSGKFTAKRRTNGSQPRVELGKVLRERRIPSSMIDISDGLSTDLSHICEENRVGAEIWADAIPCAKKEGKLLPLELAVHGGDDYELLFTAAPRTRVPSRIAGTRVTWIGNIVRGSKLRIVQNGVRSPLRPAGWEHTFSI